MIALAALLLMLATAPADGEPAAKEEHYWTVVAFCRADSPRLEELYRIVLENDKKAYAELMLEQGSGCFDLGLIQVEPLTFREVRVMSRDVSRLGTCLEFVLLEPPGAPAPSERIVAWRVCAGEEI